jgi:hypothetical protein
MTKNIKSIYLICLTVFLTLFLVSSGFAHPRSWWSIHKITEYHQDGFSATFSTIKILSYALLSLVIAIFINHIFTKDSLKHNQ